MKDFYYILGTARDAEPPEIEAAYEKLARKFYRDGEGPDEFMDSHFREIAEAYDVLRDTSRRRKYDMAFRRNQQKSLAAFKLKYLNLAVTITFVVVTALFTNYVIRSIRGRAAKKVTPKTIMQSLPKPVAAIRPQKHRKTTSAGSHLKIIPDTIANHPTPARADPGPAPTASFNSVSFVTLHANITGIIYLHQEPDFNSPVLAKIPNASQVRLLQKGSTYCKVMFNEQEGYVLNSSVTGP
ncbi:MAG TPA: DnaJ domain-containing protein [Mucilaginibacter sp.]|nr:DnaJ domain-containing protein [Mucilaginibacter sp.]